MGVPVVKASFHYCSGLRPPGLWETSPGGKRRSTRCGRRAGRRWRIGPGTPLRPPSLGSAAQGSAARRPGPHLPSIRAPTHPPHPRRRLMLTEHSCQLRQRRAALQPLRGRAVRGLGVGSQHALEEAQQGAGHADVRKGQRPASLRDRRGEVGLLVGWWDCCGWVGLEECVARVCGNESVGTAYTGSATAGAVR
jgi:hypothetical protein